MAPPPFSVIPRGRGRSQTTDTKGLYPPAAPNTNRSSSTRTLADLVNQGRVQTSGLTYRALFSNRPGDWLSSKGILISIGYQWRVGGTLGLSLTGQSLEFPEFLLARRGSFKMAATATCGAGVPSLASTAGLSGTTSFQRKSKASGADGGGPRLLSIAGTRPSVRNGQLLVSTGLPALDQLLGRFWLNTRAQPRENLGRDPWGSPSSPRPAQSCPALLTPLPFTNVVSVACYDRDRVGRLAWRCLEICARCPSWDPQPLTPLYPATHFQMTRTPYVLLP